MCFILSFQMAVPGLDVYPGSHLIDLVVHGILEHIVAAGEVVYFIRLLHLEVDASLQLHAHCLHDLVCMVHQF